MYKRQYLGFMYQYLPLILCLTGLFLWGVAIFSPTPYSFEFSRIVLATPILGLGPLLISPIVTPDIYIIMIHLFLSLIFIIRLRDLNSDWFASHLGQL